MSEVREVKVPDIGDFDEVDVIEVLVGEGDTVAENDSLITLESDKASMEIPSPVGGRIVRLAVQVGDKVGEGAVVAEIEVEEEDASGTEGDAESSAAAAGAVDGAEEGADGGDAAPTEQPAEDDGETPSGAAPESAAETAAPADGGPRPAPVDPPADGGDRALPPHASPGVRRFARELGVDLRRVEGSGRKGRILREDVQAAVKRVMEAATGAPGEASVGAGIPPIPAVDFSKFGPTEEVELSRIRRVSARNLSRSWLNVPHVTQFDEADITEMEAFRKGQKDDAARRGVKLTPLAFLMKASVVALQEFPDFNSSLAPSGESLVRKGYYHLGIAVDTPNGLVVPVIRDVDRKGLYELAGELGEVSERAREGKLTPRDIQGASFTISSLGGIGGTNFTPIVNAPEVAILGVARSKWEPQWNGSEFVPRLMLPFSVSYDHRVIDGAAGVRFTGFLASVLTDLRRMLL